MSAFNIEYTYKEKVEQYLFTFMSNDLDFSYKELAVKKITQNHISIIKEFENNNHRIEYCSEYIYAKFENEFTI